MQTNHKRGAGMEELQTEYLFLDNPIRENEASSFTQLFFSYCGFENCRPGHSYGPYARTNYVIHVVRSGRGILSINRKRYEVGPGQMFVLVPGETTTYQADEAEPWSYCWIGFRGGAAENLVREIGFTKDRPVLAIRDVQAFSELIRDMLQLRSRRMLDSLLRQSCLYRLMAMLIENAELCGFERESAVDTELSYASYALRFIQRNFQNRIRVSDIAEHIGISRGYLTRLIKEATGMPPQEYLITLRLEHAARFLRHSSDPIRDVALSSGYTDSLAFSKAFKLRYGLSPSEYHEKYFRTEENGGGRKDGDSIPEEQPGW